MVTLLFHGVNKINGPVLKFNPISSTLFNNLPIFEDRKTSDSTTKSSPKPQLAQGSLLMQLN